LAEAELGSREACVTAAGGEVGQHLSVGVNASQADVLQVEKQQVQTEVVFLNSTEMALMLQLLLWWLLNRKPA
jgi:hypothetical protein